MNISNLKRSKNQKKLSSICFVLFSAWMLSFTFEGPLLYSLVENANIDPSKYIFIAIIGHFLGLFSGGFIVKKQVTAKMTMIVSILICLAGTLMFFLRFSIVWYITLIIIAIFAGLFISSSGFYFKTYSRTEIRHKTIADVLIYANIIMIMINVVTVNVSAKISLMLEVSILIAALVASFMLEADSEKKIIYKTEDLTKLPSIFKPFLILCIFITIITINSGIMYQVVTPAYGQYELLASYYWAVPYILALWILRNLSDKYNRAYILYIALAMIGLSYIAFMWLDTSVTSYLIINTLMLGAFGVCDMFWWSIMGSFFDYSENPAKILGIGLSMNVLGILIGGFIGNKVFFVKGDYTNASIIALIIVFFVIMVLPLLNAQLTNLLQTHVFLVRFSRIIESEQEQTIQTSKYSNQLTEKEKEVVKLLLRGYTYKGIAENLFITENTMKYHTKNIYQKLNINSKMELIKLFLEKE
ncbi:MAG: helix-turn-helix transcriptional regulator [Firmicutes bacterium HGW-Firmicutes-7]|nr:MAG: helix-turn-helix transcriptional regulator [Firmicutes bacterium HGW-Firmicutes-7]